MYKNFYARAQNCPLMCVCVLVSRNNNKQNRFVKYTTHGISRNKKLCCGSASLSLPLTHSRVVKRYTWKRKKSSSWFFFVWIGNYVFLCTSRKMHWCNAMLWVFLFSHTMILWKKKVEGESGCVFYRWWLLYHMRSNAKKKIAVKKKNLKRIDRVRLLNG